MPLSPRNFIAFDYGCLSKSQANTLRKAAERIRKTGHDAFLQIGGELLNAKEWLKHGQFEHWVENECHLGIRSAERAIQAARVVAKNDKLSPLAVDALIALSGAADEIVEEVVREIDSGRFPTAASIRDRLAGKPDADADDGDDPQGSEKSGTTTAAPVKIALPTLDDLTALWDRADSETQSLFRQHIGCGGDYAGSAEEAA